ncbi:response regulator [Novosphingobium sp. 9]|uniref:response regulator n=1 Tax=Novosphingobium sp. 9 TaxID=2025349 RepID=UPI0021B57E43|nr:response regulator [Novosphingobium sp. 9]
MLIVEDEMIVAMNIEDTLMDLGAIVIGPAMRLDTALELAGREEFDVAMLDVNIHGGRSYPVATLLRSRGIPFIFATGYGHASDGEDFSDVATLAKPFRAADLEAALCNALQSRRNVPRKSL